MPQLPQRFPRLVGMKDDGRTAFGFELLPRGFEITRLNPAGLGIAAGVDCRIQKRIARQ